MVGKGQSGQADTSVECGLGGSFSMRKAELEDNLSLRPVRTPEVQSPSTLRGDGNSLIGSSASTL